MRIVRMYASKEGNWARGISEDGTTHRVPLARFHPRAVEQYDVLRYLSDNDQLDVVAEALESTRSLDAVCRQYRSDADRARPNRGLNRRMGRPLQCYAIRRRDTREIKLGISRDPAMRLADLQSAHGSPLELVATWPGGVAEEEALHARFASHRKLGEWFHEAEEITEWIATKCQSHS